MNTAKASLKARSRADHSRGEEEHISVLAALGAWRLGSVLANRLPPEILARIFKCLVFPIRPQRSWIFLTHVCRSWRDIGIQCQVLWCYVHSSYPADLITACLERSGEMPLEVVFDSPKLLRAQKRDLASAFTEAFNGHLSRIEAFNCITTPFKASILMGAFLLNLTSLRHLRAILSFHTIIPEGGALLTFEDMRNSVLLENVVAHVPPLRTICWQYFSIPRWNLPLFRGLEVLTIKEHTVEHAPSIDGFIEVLKSCSCLRYLSLEGAGPTLFNHEEPERPQPQRHVLDLPPSLETFNLAPRHFYDAAYLLSFVGLPATTSLSVALKPLDHRWHEEPHESQDQALGILLPRDPSHLHMLRSLPILSLKLKHRSGPIITLVVQGGEDPDRKSVASNPSGLPSSSVMTSKLKSRPRVNFTVKFDTSLVDSIATNNWCRRALYDLRIIFAQSSVQYLDIDISLDVICATGEDWTALFLALPSLKRLWVLAGSIH